MFTKILLPSGSLYHACKLASAPDSITVLAFKVALILFLILISFLHIHHMHFPSSLPDKGQTCHHHRRRHVLAQLSHGGPIH